MFQGLITQIFIYNFHSNDISATKIPPVQHLLQQLDLTVNKFAKDFMKKISKEFCKPIETDLQNGQELDNIKADYRLTVLKPLQGK